MDTLRLAHPLEVLRRSGEGTHLRQMTAVGKQQDKPKVNHRESRRGSQGQRRQEPRRF